MSRRKHGIKGRILTFVMALFMMPFCVTGCGGSNSAEDALLLHLKFDETTGNTINDVTENTNTAEVQYRYTKPVYKSAEDPQWRQCGVRGGCLLFDGNSTYISYKPSEICLQGQQLTISVWVAPRAFEWDDPNAKQSGTESLTAIVSQYDQSEKQGVLLGYQRYGQLCFQVGTGDKWYKLWGEDAYLNKYEWNQVTATFDGENGSMNIYLNGKEIGSQKVEKGASIVAAETEKLLIGKNSDAESLAAGTYNMFSGLMDELEIAACVYTEERLAELKSIEPDAIPFDEIWLEDILEDDVYKPQYHGGPYQFWMNEPHAPLYYNGKYHLFYQANIVGTYWRNICWGHLVSEDMVNWTPIKEAITPTEGSVVPDGVWSGGATTDENGVPLLFFTAGNDSFAKEGLVSNQNIGVAYPVDLEDENLTDWVIADELAIAQEIGLGRSGEFRDPSIWKEGNVWCMLICSGSTESSGGTALLYTTDRLELMEDGTIAMDWKYKGPVYEMENQPVTYGSSWELPILLPLSNEAGTVKKYILIISPAPAGIADNKIYYFLGDFDVTSGRFTPDEAFAEKPRLLDYGANVFTGPSAFIDPVSGEVCMFSIMQDQRSGAEEGAAGWAHGVGLTRRLWLNDDGSDVQMEPLKNIQSLEREILIRESDVSLQEANASLQNIDGDMLHVKAVIDAGDANEFGITVKSDGARNATWFTYQMSSRTIEADTNNPGSTAALSHVTGQLELADGLLYMDIYIDRSLVEAYFNESKSITMRSYGDYEAQGISFFADEDILIKELYVASMNPI